MRMNVRQIRVTLTLTVQTQLEDLYVDVEMGMKAAVYSVKVCVASLVGSSFIAHCACKSIEIYGCDGIVQTELIQLGHYYLMITGCLSLLTLTSKSWLLCVPAAPILQQCRDNL